MQRPSAGSREALAEVIAVPRMGKIEAMPLDVAATAKVAHLVRTVVTSIRVLGRADGPFERLRFISFLLSGTPATWRAAVPVFFENRERMRTRSGILPPVPPPGAASTPHATRARAPSR